MTCFRPSINLEEVLIELKMKKTVHQVNDLFNLYNINNLKMKNTMRKNYFASSLKMALGGFAWGGIDYLSYTFLERPKITVSASESSKELFENAFSLKDQTFDNYNFWTNFIYGTFVVNLGKLLYRNYLLKSHFFVRLAVVAPTSIVSYYAFCNVMN